MSFAKKYNLKNNWKLKNNLQKLNLKEEILFKKASKHNSQNKNSIDVTGIANTEDKYQNYLTIRNKKSNNLSGFITYEAIFEYFIENYYSSMTEFHIPLKHLDIIVKNVITLNKNENLHKCMETFYKEGISMLPILDDDKKIFGYFYLKDIIYFFSMGEKFNFNNTVENFLKDLYEDIDDELPYGKKRIKELTDDTNLKKVFEEMSTSPERKLIIKNDDTKIGIIALYDIFKKLVI